MKKYPMHGKDAQARVTTDGKIENETDIVEKEYKGMVSNKKPFKKIYDCVNKKKK
jgi:hypothetical protein